MITRTIWLLSIVSLMTDMASEMLYPVMPVYLRHIGFSVFWIGILEGLAEAIAGLSKGYFGNLSDHWGKRLPFVQLGYSLSALSKPMMAMLVHPVWVLGVRITDRLGKGIRTGARDAMLSAEATPETKATVFGFHRSLDTIGAVIGPALALLFLYWYPGHYRWLFLIALFPGLIAIAATFLLQEKHITVNKDQRRNNPGFLSFLSYWKSASPMYRRLTAGLLAFALFNSSDIFLLVAAKEAGGSDTWVIGIYIFYNLVYTITAFPAGILADGLGLKRIFMLGIFIFALVYGGMSFVRGNWSWYMVLFALYGIYAACTEGIAKAWITQLCKKEETATAIGTFTAFQSIAALGASTFAGFLWWQFGAEVTFGVTAVVSLLVLLYIYFFIKKPDIELS